MKSNPILQTLTYLIKNNDILIMKRRSSDNLFPNKYIGLGGKIIDGESLLQATKREFFEESGLKIFDIDHRGGFFWKTTNEWGFVYIMIACSYKGCLIPNSEEGELFWMKKSEFFKSSKIAKHQLRFLPELLKDDNRIYSGSFIYDEFSNEHIMENLITL